jgi:hypothetical protein
MFTSDLFIPLIISGLQTSMGEILILYQMVEASRHSFSAYIKGFLSLDPAYEGGKPAHVASLLFNGAVVVQF